MRIAAIPKQEVIDRLAIVFRRLGYEGATLSELSSGTGLQRASLYHYFPGGKEEMARAVLEQINDGIKKNVLGPLEADGDPGERLRCMAQALDGFYAGGKLNCLIGLFILSASHELFHDDIRNTLQAWIAALARLMTETGIAPELARQRAERWIGELQGSLIMSRGLGSNEPFRRMMDVLPLDSDQR